jgi:glycosyltransferase involved in cell wall biosynthesis
VVAGAAPYKGIETVVGAAQVLVRALPGTRIVVVGRVTESPVWRDICRSIERAGLDDCFEWLGVVGPQQLARELREAACLVSASHVENSSNSICEAMMVGCPVVATNVGGTASLIRDGIDGILIPPGDARALADGVFRLCVNHFAAAQMGSAARARARERHDPDVVCATVLGVYEELARGGRQHAAS